MPGLELEGKFAVVTGASRGIGAATAIELARQGAQGIVLVSTGVNKEALDNVAHQIEFFGAKTHIHSADLSDADTAEKIIDSAKKEFGSIHILLKVR